MKKVVYKAMFYVLLVILVHAFMIYALGIRSDGWRSGVLLEICITYIAPIALSYLVCFLCLKKADSKKLMIWIISSILSGLLLLITIKGTVDWKWGQSKYEYVNLVEFKFTEYYFEMVYFFPMQFFVVQIIIISVFWKRWRVKKKAVF
ncbi:hypothetical protein [Paenibacillus sp. GCM10012306]|uniref:hypothetical protein n=1 Tax=Paenibacillus sp. GCM10012306 TaxID=3317342 RepID=UPI00360E7841